MPSNPAPRLTQDELKKLVKLLTKFETFIRGEQPLAAEIVARVLYWAKDELE